MIAILIVDYLRSAFLDSNAFDAHPAPPSRFNFAAGPGVSFREALLKTGETDYLLFSGGKAIATVKAKSDGYGLTGDLE